MNEFSTRDMRSNNTKFDLNVQYPVEELTLENGYSEAIDEHFDLGIVARDVLEINEIGIYEKENCMPSSQDVEMNEFLEESDEDMEKNIIPFVGQIFLSEKEAFVLDGIKQKEEHDIMLEKCKRLNMKLMSPVQMQAHSVLTYFAFQKFQAEFERSIQYLIHHENGNVFVLGYYKDANSIKHTVFWDGKIATCTCKHFVFLRILFRHILSIFLHKDCH